MGRRNEVRTTAMITVWIGRLCEGDKLAINHRSSKKNCQHWRHCDITLPAHDNINVLLIINVSLCEPKMMPTCVVNTCKTLQVMFL